MPGPDGTMQVAPAVPAALYVHFPFCARRCHYCDFAVSRSERPPVEEWLAVVEVELGWWFAAGGWEPGSSVDTVYVGGGTPSLLGADGMRGLRDVLAGKLDLSSVREWNAEANPVSFSAALAEAWAESGVNRVSLGVQSFDDRVLSWLGRSHTAARAAEAVREARRGGIRRFNLDIMFGLPDTVGRDLPAELERVAALQPPHLSLYGLSVEPGTLLARRIARGVQPGPDPEKYADEFVRIAEYLTTAGYEHYEVSNFCLPGEESLHNQSYWNRSACLGLGPSSHGFHPPSRCWNLRNWPVWRDSVMGGHGPLEGHEVVGAEDSRLEKVWLGLRTRNGVDSGILEASHQETLSRFESAGWIRRSGGRVRPTARGWLRLDSIVAELNSAGSPPAAPSGSRET